MKREAEKEGTPARVIRHRRDWEGLAARQAAELEQLRIAHKAEREALEQRHGDERWAATHPPAVKGEKNRPISFPPKVRKGGRR